MYWKDSETAPSFYASHYREICIPSQSGDELSLALQSYPEADTNLIELDLEQQFEVLIGTIRTIRNLRQRRILSRGEGDGDFAK